MISSLASKCQDFKVEMPFFQPLYVMKLKCWHFIASEDAITKFKSQGPYTIKINYWNASGSGFPPSLIPVLRNIGILHYKKAKLRKHLQQSVLPFLRALSQVLPLTEKYLLNSKMAATIFLVNSVTVIYMRCAHLINDFLRRKPLGIKVHIFWEGHKILRNLHRRIVLCSASQIYGGDFAKFCDLLRIYEL